MYSKNRIFLFFLLAVAALTACNETDNSTVQWQNDNQAAYDAIKTNPDWKLLDTGDGPTGIYYRDATPPETETGNEYPIETALVTVNYTGKYYTEQIFDSGKKIKLTVNNTVRGFGVALQHMHIGQIWEICIPYYLGYGISSSYTTSIPDYSTLFFEIELLEITQHPQ
ncbi:MAG: FKBP-type peptidyl-prolyl cis-trans isomerase [Dysgonamonadaceae bacterium]|jgi:FKBP-type peptidyl-prolyl cis-trans isomerase|nr:FKBP-type peptidyl-prolyl cis-trans isomerase [Dysgonamonadaceae bacterium]